MQSYKENKIASTTCRTSRSLLQHIARDRVGQPPSRAARMFSVTLYQCIYEHTVSQIKRRR